jgi:hypothetical protein
MSLSEREFRLLTEIGEALMREDPRLARSLSGSFGRTGVLRTAALMLGMVSVAMEVGGAFTRQPLLCVLAWLGAVISVSVILLSPGRPPRPRGARR